MLKLMSIESMMAYNHLILCCPLLLLPSIFYQHQGLFQWVRSSHQVAKVLELQLQHQSFQFISGFISFKDTGLISLQSEELSRVLSNTTIQKHHFFSAEPSLWSNSHIHAWLLENHRFNYRDFVGKIMSLFFNMLFRFVTAFLPKSKCLLIS